MKTELNIPERLSQYISESLNSQYDLAFELALKRKGYVFDNKVDLADFVKVHCKCADNAVIGQKTYYVKGVPFLLWNYRTEINLDPFKEENNNISISGTLGSLEIID